MPMPTSTPPVWLAALALAAFAAPAGAATVFSDGTFAPSDYRIGVYDTAGMTLTVGQTATGGNPGAALEGVFTAPSGSPSFYAAAYAINTGFAYDPAASGAITGIGFGVDSWYALSANTTIGSVTARLLLEQGGQYYVYTHNLPLTPDTYMTTSVGGLQAGDFGLVTDLLKRTVDPSRNPNFSAGLIDFGTLIGFSGTATASTQIFDRRVDNLSIAISAVPEPGTLAMAVLGAFPLLLAVRRQRRA